MKILQVSFFFNSLFIFFRKLIKFKYINSGWEEYIKNIMKAGCVSHAAIIGEHNTIWAASKNLNVIRFLLFMC